ncbi:hypothetical protein QBC37DRAFT_435565 [Rhypophila decipiens]|uniref:Uncharacterized protein n=1 Tax=Rhypophila decipiens TaxID=261697 RepID=A0AAN6XSX4_9PEZI|nr:hypothetical protein QBC37DRAFT_435565 [Rhypophila decipiens]
MTTMAASTRFAGIAEMLLFLMERVASRKQLAKLRRVNKAFEMAATPFLFREVYYDVGAVYDAHPKVGWITQSPYRNLKTEARLAGANKLHLTTV